MADSDLHVSVITFGAWAAGGWMWGKTERSDAIEAIRASYDQGVTSIDTAPVYGQGESEEIVGEAIRFLPRDRVQILTKFGMRWDLAKGVFKMHSRNNQGRDIDIYKYAGKESVIKECEDSLRRLNTDYIDLYQLHWPDDSTPVGETFEAVARLIEQGKVRYAGVSNFPAPLMAETEKTLNIVSNQVPFSMVRRETEQDAISYCMRHGKAVLAYSPLERGLLTGKMHPGYQFADGDSRAAHRFCTDENIVRINAFLEKIRPLADAKNATLAQLILRWTVNCPGITVALSGARNAAQSVQNAKAAGIRLSPEEMEFINRHLKELAVV